MPSCLVLDTNLLVINGVISDADDNDNNNNNNINDNVTKDEIIGGKC